MTNSKIEKYEFLINNKSTKVLKNGRFIDLTNGNITFLKKCYASEYNNQRDNTISAYTPPVFSCILKNVHLVLDSGGLIYNGILQVESFLSLKKMFRSSTYKGNLKDKAIITKKGIVTSIHHAFSTDNNIYHWYIECLPRLYTLKLLNVREITVLCLNSIEKFQEESIRIFCQDFCDVKIELIDPKYIYQCEEYLFLSFYSGDRCSYLPKNVLKIYNKPKKKIKKNRVYISRKNAASRKILNEGAFEKLLNNYGYKTLYLEKISPRGQREIFRTVDSVIGVHGAGFANIIFSDKCLVNEIQPSKKINPHYFFIAKAKKLDYNYFISQSLNNLNDIKIDIAKMKQWLDKIHPNK